MHTNAWLGADHFTIVSLLNFENPYFGFGFNSVIIKGWSEGVGGVGRLTSTHGDVLLGIILKNA